MDLLDSQYWADLHVLLAELDADIAAVYTRAGVAGMRTRFVGPLIALGRFGPMTIQELADHRGKTHSATSQTVAAMVEAGLVATGPGPDGRTRVVTPTGRSGELLPLLMAEWRATEATIRELDAEIPYALDQVVRDLRSALERRPFAARLDANLERFRP